MSKQACYVAGRDEMSTIRSEVKVFYELNDLPLEKVANMCGKLTLAMHNCRQASVYELAVDDGKLQLLPLDPSDGEARFIID